MSRPAGKLIAAVIITILLTLLFCLFTGANPFDVNIWIPVPSTSNIEELNNLNQQGLQQQVQQAENIIGTV